MSALISDFDKSHAHPVCRPPRALANMPSENDNVATTIAEIVNLRPVAAMRHKISLRYEAEDKKLEAESDAYRKQSWSERSKPYLGLMKFPHALASAFDAISRLEAEQNSLAEKYRNIGRPGRKTTYVVNQFDAYPLAFAVESYLESAARAQSGAWDYASRALGFAMPQSLDKFMTGLKSNKRPGVPAALRESGMKYWDSGGADLRQYRDLSQHYMQVTSTINLVFLDDGGSALQFALPSNLYEEKASQRRYTNPLVLVFPYCEDSFVHLVRWIYEMADIVAPEIIDPSTVEPQFVIKNGDAFYTVDPNGTFAKSLSAVLRDENERRMK